MKRIASNLWAGALFLLILAPGFCFAAQDHKLHVRVFHLPNCSACVKTIHDVIPPIAEKYKDRVIWEYVDISNADNYKNYLQLEKIAGRSLATPTIVVGRDVLVGLAQAADKLDFLVGRAVKEPQGFLSLDGGNIDLLERFRSFGPLAVIGAGLVDGINPCAFTVIVFFVSFLTVMGYQKRELVIISLAYIFAVFSTYLALGFGFFKILYSLKIFYVVSRVVYMVIGGLSLFLGCLAFKDFLLYKKTNQTEGMALQLPRIVKNKIHQIVGAYYRKDKTGQKKAMFGLFTSALAVGFLVSLLEAVCTGQLYLPTIIFVLKEGTLRAKALAYLIVYNLMFVLPLVIVFLFALAGATSKQFEAFARKHIGVIKIAMAVVFFALGVALWLGA